MVGLIWKYSNNIKHPVEDAQRWIHNLKFLSTGCPQPKILTLAMVLTSEREVGCGRASGFQTVAVRVTAVC